MRQGSEAMRRWMVGAMLAGVMAGCEQGPGARGPGMGGGSAATQAETQAASPLGGMEGLGATTGVLPLYAWKLETVSVGALPEDVVVLGGSFAVREFEGRRVVELPGEPLDSFALVCGPQAKAGVSVRVDVLGQARARQLPVFEVGLNGVAGHRLRVSPGRKQVELVRDDEVVTAKALAWRAGEWMTLRLQVRETGLGRWRVEGKAWHRGDEEPSGWMVEHETTTEPVNGQASIWGSPYSGHPIRYEGLRVERARGQAGAGGD